MDDLDGLIQIDEILRLDSESGMVLLIRHAERTPILKMDHVIHADLTEAGFQSARQFGFRLSEIWKIEEVYSSPLSRCINTLDSILVGAGMDTDIRLKWWLFSPWLACRVKPAAENHCLSFTYNDYTSYYDTRRLDMLLNRLKFPEQPGSVNLYVAHDTTVLPVLLYLQGRTDIKVPAYPAFLEGIVLRRNQTGIELLGE